MAQLDRQLLNDPAAKDYGWFVYIPGAYLDVLIAALDNADGLPGVDQDAIQALADQARLEAAKA